MDAITAYRLSAEIQTAFSIILLSINLFGYLFPEPAHVEDGFTYDFIVVGAGSAGSVIASRLTDNEKFNVLVVEAGGDPPIQCMVPGLMAFAQSSLIDWNYTSQSDDYTMKCLQNDVQQMTQGKVLGGSSCSGYMLYSRGNPYDFNRWADISKDDTWSWKNVLRYFIKSEKLEDSEILKSPNGKYHGTQGYMKVKRQLSNITHSYLESFKEVGIPTIADINGDQTQGYTQPMYTIGDNYKQNAAYCFISPVKDRTNLHIMKDSLATKIIFNKDKKATGVQIVLKNNKKIIVNAKREIIISAGAINSPQLLMLSGIGPKGHLKSLNIDVINDLPVGENFQDHALVPIYIQMEKSNEPIPPRNPNIYPYETVNGYVALNKSQTFPDYEVKIIILPHDTNLAIPYAGYDLKFKYDVIQKVIDKNKGRNIAVALLMSLHPKSKGQILLRSAHATDDPLIYAGYYSEKVDLENTVTYIKDFLKVLDTDFFKSANATLVDLAGDRCSGFKEGSRQFWRCYTLCMLISNYDFSGTCGLGSVVDSKLRVIGVTGLRVADASVAPVPTSGNMNAVAMMIGEMVSDMIKNDYR